MTGRTQGCRIRGILASPLRDCDLSLVSCPAPSPEQAADDAAHRTSHSITWMFRTSSTRVSSITFRSRACPSTP